MIKNIYLTLFYLCDCLEIGVYFFITHLLFLTIWKISVAQNGAIQQLFCAYNTRTVQNYEASIHQKVRFQWLVNLRAFSNKWCVRKWIPCCSNHLQKITKIIQKPRYTDTFIHFKVFVKKISNSFKKKTTTKVRPCSFNKGLKIITIG